MDMVFVVGFNQCSIFFVAVIRQHDTMIFPEAKDKSNIIVQKFKDLKDYITGSSGSDHPRFKVPATDKMRSMCLDIYLDAFKKTLLSGNFKENWEICKGAEGFATLFRSCYCQYCGNTEFSHQDWIISRINIVRLLLHDDEFSHNLCIHSVGH